MAETAHVHTIDNRLESLCCSDLETRKSFPSATRYNQYEENGLSVERKGSRQHSRNENASAALISNEQWHKYLTNRRHMTPSQWEFDGGLMLQFFKLQFRFRWSHERAFILKGELESLGTANLRWSIRGTRSASYALAKQIPFSRCRKAKRLGTRRSRRNSLLSIVTKTSRFLTRPWGTFHLQAMTTII